MEVGGGGANGIPADEVGDGQFVTTFVDITPELEAIQAGDVVAEEYGVGDAEGQLPGGGLFLSVEGGAAQGGPTVDEAGNLGGCQLAVVATLANAQQQGAGAVAFYIII